MAEFNQKTLFYMVMKNNWDGVLEVYRNTELYKGVSDESDPGRSEGIHTAKITSSGDTALHIAASEGRADMLKKLIDVLGSLAKDALKIQNDHGNTPLHLAAAAGNTDMCAYITQVDDGLVDCRNEEGNTPLFLTSLHGKMGAFKSLHNICNSKGMEEYYRGNGGETILHCAIKGEYFELAMLIMKLHVGLVSYMDETGMSPLHLLANKPQVFRSGTYFSWLESIVYSCITVKKLPEPDQNNNQTGIYLLSSTSIHPGQESRNIEAPSHQWFPPNYITCCDFLNCIYHVLWVSSGWVSNSRAAGENAKNSGAVEDAENPNKDNAKRHGQTRVEVKAKDQPQGEGPLKFPPNYGICFELMNLVYKLTLVILGLGYNEIQKIKDLKEKHEWAVQILKKMLENTKIYAYDAGGRFGSSASQGETSAKNALESPPEKTDQDAKNHGPDKTDNKAGMKMDRKETPLLTAARNGIKEIVESILEHFPVAIHDRNSDKKNVVMLAVENRQPHLYDLLKQKCNQEKGKHESVFQAVDIKGNSVLHLAANYKKSMNLWIIPGAALQMQWEIKWYEYVKRSMPPNLMLYNNDGMTAAEVFTETHKTLIEDGGKWLNKTSDSCSVVAALIATVAFATSATIPGGTDKGKPVLGKELAFRVFSISSLVSLCCSVISLVMFLAILTSRYRENEFRMALPNKLLWGLSSLMISIAAILVSFCAGHFFILDDRLKSVAFPIYAVTCVPATIFALSHLPLYFDLICAIFTRVPTILYNGRQTPSRTET